jgi:uncharacterized protein (DUF1697 family)
MKTYVCLLRAVNVGGTGNLPMAELKATCARIGGNNVRTYIASGNALLDSSKSEGQVKQALEAELERYAGKPIGVAVRTAKELAAVLAGNPFPDAPPDKTVAIFLDAAPPKSALDGIKGASREEVRLGKREFYVHYPDGQGRSKLKIPGAAAGTARNMNTIAKLVEMAVGAKGSDPKARPALRAR